MTTPQPKDPRWRKSSFSGGSGEGDCVEIALTPHATSIRDTKDAAGKVLHLTTGAWHALLLTLTQ